jgi:hypothetical protein
MGIPPDQADEAGVGVQRVQRLLERGLDGGGLGPRVREGASEFGDTPGVQGDVLGVATAAPIDE